MLGTGLRVVMVLRTVGWVASTADGSENVYHACGLSAIHETFSSLLILARKIRTQAHRPIGDISGAKKPGNLELFVGLEGR